ncbi:fungal-specific transcription factor domain-containing protein [Pseudomassariella vexata]|uniref:Fungal-specific transcription factor domain-domain-containing protein n=1 Tax=Pseudomassariella vexata TaxID=1141098 RepID=A0A1Y2DGT4_9PEZI|nr:fungal-specific transcription factor domain-containing protein [Pseudomassariella vexata]ORY58469.1 fungal-specific transcription factor domain-domain-containing protein [Pseudomassariella vexata]
MKSSVHRFRISRTTPSQSIDKSMTPPTDERPRSDSYGTTSSTTDKPPTPSVSRSSHIPACDRCRGFKKRCSRTFPICSLCASAGQKCSFSTPASSAAAQVHHLRARVDWLTMVINEALPAGSPGIETVETGSDVSRLLQGISSNTWRSQNGTSPADVIPGNHQEIPGSGSDSGSGDQNILDQPNEAPPRLPSNAAARRFVDAYFRNVHRAYPFVDRNRILHDLETLGDFAKRRRDPGSTLLYLIMAIGCTTLERAGQIPRDTASKFDVAYTDIIQECLNREIIESVQILVLLALYSLFDPTGASPWSIVGIVSRQAMMLGLTRRATSDDHSSGSCIPAIETELRHRLYWSIYVLDRMISTSLGLPVSLTDENTDVPLPGLTIAEFASPDRPHFAVMLQTSRHVIQLRQLEDRILKQVHFRKQAEVSMLTAFDRRAILQDIRADVENWYSNGCLVSTPLEPDNVPIHNSITWLSARYYYLLLLMYYPCHFNSPLNSRSSHLTSSSSSYAFPVASASVVSQLELLRFAQKHIQSTSALFQQRQLPLNRVTLCRLFPVGLVFMQGFIAWGGTECVAHDFPASDEVLLLVNILDAFPEGWKDARRAATVLTTFLDVIAGTRTVAGTRTETTSSSRAAYHDVLEATLTAYLGLLQEVLGTATCYQFLEMSDEREVVGMDMDSGVGESMNSPLGMRRESMETGMNGINGVDTLGVVGGEEGVMGYGGWGRVEMDFL